LADLIAYAKANPGKLNYGSGGNGSAGHLAGEMFKKEAGIFAVHIPYNGGNPAQLALLSSQVDFNFDNLATAAPNIRSGKLKALAVTTKKRLLAFPLVPTMAESGFPEFEMVSWYGLWAPANLPPAIAKRLAELADKAMNSKAVRDLLGQQGFIPELISGENFSVFLNKELAQYSKIVKISQIQMD
jgi:tripartite-type tricarboxylate transporter receptor subunit TctC